MKKFISKSLLFTLPFLLIHFINVVFYNVNDGDLIRVGYIYSNPCPNKKINEDFHLKKAYTQISQIDVNKKSEFDIITIGDSFSDQDSLGYQNFLVQKGYSVLDLDKNINENPIDQLIKLVNGDFFNTVKTNYVVLESVERKFIDYTKSVNINSSIQNNTLRKDISLLKKNKRNNQLDFFSETTLKAPLSNISYSFVDKPQFSQTFKVETTKNTLFSNFPNHLLFFQDDYFFLPEKNNLSELAKANKIINDLQDVLKKKNIQLILVIAPDKYDLYYPFILDKNQYSKSFFFDNLEKLQKKYSNLDAFKTLSKAVQKKKNVYYYADTHWSPIGAKIIAEELDKIISTSNKNLP